MLAWVQAVSPELPAEILKATANRVFIDCKENGFSKSLSLGYNVLYSAALYLETGKTLMGNRTKTFFEEAK
jgi:hypothetical protein